MVIMMEEWRTNPRFSKRFKKEDFYDNKELLDEVGDVYTMIQIMGDFDMISWDDIEKR